MALPKLHASLNANGFDKTFAISAPVFGCAHGWRQRQLGHAHQALCLAELLLHPAQGKLVLGGQFLGQCQHLGGATKRQALRCFVRLFFVFGRCFVFAIVALARILRSLGCGLAGCIGFSNRNGCACEHQR